VTNYDDPVDAVMLAFLDYLEGTMSARPTLDHLTEDDRRRAEELMASLEAGRGIDPHASRPSVEALLAGTGLAGLLPLSPASAARAADPANVRDVLAGVDARAWADIGSGGTVVYGYLDLRARFVLVNTDTPVAYDEARALAERLFDGDADTTRVGIVAARSYELVTQVLTAADVGCTVTAPRGEPHTQWTPPLPLAMAARQMLEQCAPEWEPADFDRALSEPLDVAAIAAEIAGRIIGREAARPYRGDKARAYRALTGNEAVFAALVVAVAEHGTGAVDLEGEITRMTRAAA
jgi:hypothetical protein